MHKSGRENYKEGENLLQKYVKEIAKRLSIEAIVLFGSAARKEGCKYSDYDLLVISKNLPLDFRKRTDLLWQDKPDCIDVLGFTPTELKENIHRGLLLNALIEGKTLYGEANLFRKIAQDYLEKEGLVKTALGYTHKMST